MDRNGQQQLRGAVALRQEVAPEVALATTSVIVEEERRWIAAEVHDRIAQNLAGAFLQLQSLESLVTDDPEVRRVVLRASSLLREAIRECRDIMKELHPPGLDEFGIVPLIEEELKQFSEDSGCEALFVGNRQVRRSGAIEVALYRVFHEALTNVRRHAPTARKVLVTFERKDRGIILQIEDDGQGFDVAAAWRSGHVGGLMSMQRRIEGCGGTVEIMSIPVQGTRVKARVPFGLSRNNAEIQELSHAARA